MESLSFDAMAEIYDETRPFDRPSFDAALDWLAAEFPPSDFPRVFEPGIGTGRIALPLAERGYRVDGIDLSPRMLAVLEERLAQSPVRPPVSYRVGDVLALPWPDAEFDLVIAVPIFSCVVGLMKPDPRIYRLAAERLGVEPSDCLYVGDGIGQELPGAAEVGMHPVMIRTPDYAAHPFSMDVADWPGPLVSSLTEVLALLT